MSLWGNRMFLRAFWLCPCLRRCLKPHRVFVFKVLVRKRVLQFTAAYCLGEAPWREDIFRRTGSRVCSPHTALEKRCSPWSHNFLKILLSEPHLELGVLWCSGDTRSYWGWSGESSNGKNRRKQGQGAEGVGNGEKTPRFGRAWSGVTRTWLLLRGRWHDLTYIIKPFRLNYSLFPLHHLE